MRDAFVERCRLRLHAWVRPLRRMPRVRQRDTTDCGAACLSAVAAWHRLHTPVARLRQLAGTDRDGTTMLGLIDAANRLGFTARGVRGPVESLGRVPLPAIAHVRLPHGASHFVVVYRVDRRHVVVMDPAGGDVARVPLGAFARSWTGALVLLVPGERFRPGRSGASPARRLLALARPHRTVMAQALVGALVYTLLGLSTSVYVQKVVDYVLTDGNRNLLNLMSVAMVALIVAQSYVGAMKSVLTLRTGQRIDAELILGYYTHLLRLPQRFFDTMRVGEITSRVSDAVKIRAFINDVALDLAVSALVIGLSLAFMALYSPTLALVVTATMPLHWAIYSVNNRLNRRTQRVLMERAAELESHLVESITAMSTVKRFGLEWFAELRTETRFVRLLRGVHASATTALAAGAGTDLVARLGTVALLWVGAGLVLDRQMTPGALMSCYALVGYLGGPVNRLIGMNRTAQDALIAVDRLFEIMDLEREDSVPQIDLAPDMVGDLRFEQLSVRYGGRARVLHDVTFTARRGTLTAIVGESGSGKSTLAAIVQRVYTPDAGRVRIGEHDVAHLSLGSLRRAVGVVPQRADLFTGTILENIALGDFEPDLRRVADVCGQLGLGEFVGSLPGGLHTQVGEQGATLSGGQRQRIAIARALYHAPEVLILDEATAALDSIAEQYVQRAAGDLTRAGKTVLVIAHRLSTVVHADNVVVLEGGRVVEQGTHAELLRRGGAYSRLWAHQFPVVHPDVVAA